MAEHLDKIKERVRKSKLNITIIAKETGLKRQWLYDLMSNRISGKEYERIKQLDLYLKEHVNTMAAIDD